MALSKTSIGDKNITGIHALKNGAVLKLHVVPGNLVQLLIEVVVDGLCHLNLTFMVDAAVMNTVVVRGERTLPEVGSALVTILMIFIICHIALQGVNVSPRSMSLDKVMKLTVVPTFILTIVVSFLTFRVFINFTSTRFTS